MNHRGIRSVLQRVRRGPPYWTERAVLDFTSALWRVMQRRDVSQADLSRKLGKNPAFVSRVLNGASNVTIKTMVEMAHALDAHVQINVIEAEGRPIVASITALETNRPLKALSATHVTTRPLAFASVQFAANDSDHGTSVAA